MDTENSDYVSSMSGDVIEIINKTKEFSVLSEARIRVRATRTADVPQIVYQRVEDRGCLLSYFPRPV